MGHTKSTKGKEKATDTEPSGAPAPSSLEDPTVEAPAIPAVGSSSSTTGAPDSSSFVMQQGPPVPYDRHTDDSYKSRPFGEQFLRETDANGGVARSKDVRAPSNPVLGGGLHEMIPTDMAPKMSGSPAAHGFQATARSSTTRQLFKRTDGGIGSHSGAMQHKTGATTGQKAWHDGLRRVAESAAADSASTEELAARVLIQHVNTMPHGQETMAASSLTGYEPKDAYVQQFASPSGEKAIEPVGASDSLRRAALAEVTHNGREHLKKRATQLASTMTKDRRDRLPPMSPPREGMDQGGGYATAPRPMSPVPVFRDDDEIQRAADIGAYATQGMRNHPGDPFFPGYDPDSGTSIEDETAEPRSLKRGLNNEEVSDDRSKRRREHEDS